MAASMLGQPKAQAILNPPANPCSTPPPPPPSTLFRRTGVHQDASARRPNGFGPEVVVKVAAVRTGSV
ncbi:conserved hypothetical protein [Culex quinquefasciatus]|uniref:Uncharacterized protein n=1 Tax=Culex quinquefasciatus TaxID=7176 RepID=B0X5S8_CULQU|nr:conserved hypothetical protein [Culex quinquefasciatus]|eukprot:XP_001865000.1 conserved hypothetical protein [Culex quinquefasciatus]